MLPDGFRWQSIFGAASQGPPHALACRSHEVARLSERIGGGWNAILRYPDGRMVTRPCSSLEAGRAGCEAWAQRHRAALIAQADRKELEWLARQTWRGSDGAAARKQLDQERGA